MYIKTKRLELKPIPMTDAEDLVDLLTDPVVGKTYMVPDFADREAAGKLALRLCELSQDPKRFVAGIYLGEQVIGLLNETDVRVQSLELGYAISSRHHNQGYGTEALRGAVDYFFSQGFAEVVAGAFEENLASLRIMQKCGMSRLDKTDTVDYRGKTHRCIYYSIKNR